MLRKNRVIKQDFSTLAAWKLSWNPHIFFNRLKFLVYGCLLLFQGWLFLFNNSLFLFNNWLFLFHEVTFLLFFGLECSKCCCLFLLLSLINRLILRLNNKFLLFFTGSIGNDFLLNFLFLLQEPFFLKLLVHLVDFIFHEINLLLFNLILGLESSERSWSLLLLLAQHFIGSSHFDSVFCK